MEEQATVTREPLQARVAGWLERAFNPIMVKELRGSLRGARFFIAHLTILSFFACGLLLTFAVELAWQADRAPQITGAVGDPSRVGRVVYGITQMLHLAVVFLVVPGLAATSITSERETLTHDLLLSTTLTAQQIVWGKFTAAMAQTFTIFVSMVPLVGLCFLFGGVTVYQILASYAFLFGLSALMTVFALSISANSRGTVRAVMTVYALALLALLVGGVLVGAVASGAGRSGFLTEAAVAYGFVSPAGEEATQGAGLPMFERVMYVHLMPAFAWAALLALFFINASNRLKPIFANRSTNLRVYFTAVLLAGSALAIATFYHELPPSKSGPQDRAATVMGYAIATLTATLMCSLFACEDPVLPPHLAAELSGLRGTRRILRLLWPGSASGSAFCLVVNTLFLAVSFLAFVPFSTGFDRGTWKGLPFWYPTGLAFAAALLWIYFCTMFARFLAVALASRPVLLRTVLVLTCLFLAIFPIVHWAVAQQIDRDEADRTGRTGPITLALSPVAAILSALDLYPHRRQFPLTSAGLPIPALFALFATAAGSVFFGLAGRAESRLKADAARLRERKTG